MVLASRALVAQCLDFVPNMVSLEASSTEACPHHALTVSFLFRPRSDRLSCHGRTGSAQRYNGSQPLGLSPVNNRWGQICCGACRCPQTTSKGDPVSAVERPGRCPAGSRRRRTEVAGGRRLRAFPTSIPMQIPLGFGTSPFRCFSNGPWLGGFLATDRRQVAGLQAEKRLPLGGPSAFRFDRITRQHDRSSSKHPSKGYIP